MAASYGSIDCVELLLSAGFNATQTDSVGRTPLHCAAAAIPGGSDGPNGDLLCTQALLAAGKKAINMRDTTGATALSVACSRQKLGVAAALVQAGASPSTVDRRGRSPLDYAIECKNLDLQGILLGKDLRKEAEFSRELALSCRSDVDERRIMQVWERFFENVFRSFAEECDLDDGFVFDSQGLQSIEERHRRGEKAEINSGRVGKKTTASVPIEVDAVTVCWDELVSSWFEWLLCFDEAHQDYVVIHRYEYNVMWLSEFLEYYNDFSPAYDDGSGIPRTCYSACKDRWMQYYDPLSNQCYWFQIHSGRCEHYLPLGHDYDSVVAAGLELYEEKAENDNVEVGVWVRPSQRPWVFSWVAIYVPGTIPYGERAESSVAGSKGEPPEEVEEKTQDLAKKPSRGLQKTLESNQEGTFSDSSCGWYFFNYFTGHSSWTEPPSWAELVDADWNGWWFCRDPNSGSDYWYATTALLSCMYIRCMF
jgi:hypothetical protein